MTLDDAKRVSMAVLSALLADPMPIGEAVEVSTECLTQDELKILAPAWADTEVM
jgi:hypothetical protein